MTRQEQNAIENFLATMGAMTQEEALANAELDARSYGWSHEATRMLAFRIRVHFGPRSKIVNVICGAKCVPAWATEHGAFLHDGAWWRKV
jgi:hypothetical protein